MLLIIIPYVFICFAVLIGVALGVESQDPTTEPCHLAFWTGVMVVIIVLCLAVHMGAYATAAGIIEFK